MGKKKLKSNLVLPLLRNLQIFFQDKINFMKRNFLLLLVTFFTVEISFAQAPIKQWDIVFGGNGKDELKSMHRTSDGGYIFGSQSRSDISGDKSQANVGKEDYWIVKTDSNYVKQWDATFGTSDADYFADVVQTSDGG